MSGKSLASKIDEIKAIDDKIDRLRNFLRMTKDDQYPRSYVRVDVVQINENAHRYTGKKVALGSINQDVMLEVRASLCQQIDMLKAQRDRVAYVAL